MGSTESQSCFSSRGESGSIYFFYEDGEFWGHGGNRLRIVRIGTHKDGNFRSRIKEHFPVLWVGLNSKLKIIARIALDSLMKWTPLGPLIDKREWLNQDGKESAL
jgi:hypothetical protein